MHTAITDVMLMLFISTPTMLRKDNLRLGTSTTSYNNKHTHTHIPRGFFMLFLSMVFVLLEETYNIG